MRTHIKKKVYAEHLRSQVLAGLINAAHGGWVSNDSSVTEKCKNFSLAGTRGKGFRKRGR